MEHRLHGAACRCARAKAYPRGWFPNGNLVKIEKHIWHIENGRPDPVRVLSHSIWLTIIFVADGFIRLIRRG